MRVVLGLVALALTLALAGALQWQDLVQVVVGLVALAPLIAGALQ